MAKNVEHVSHIKSKLKTNGLPQLPSPDKLVDGEIAINYAEGVETISIKNESGSIVTFSSDNYYTEKKLGSGFTSNNATVTEAIDDLEYMVVNKEEAIAAALNDLNGRKLDASAYTPTDLSNYYTKGETSGATELQTAFNGKTDTATTTALNNVVTAHTANTNIHLTTTEKGQLHTHTNKTYLDGITRTVGTMAYENASSYSSATQVSTALNSKADKTAVDDLSGQSETVAAALNDLNTKKLDTTAYTPVDTSLYYKKTETSGATEIQTALNSKVDTTAFTNHTSSSVHMTTTEKTNLDSLATNIAAISGITATKVSNWDDANTKKHTHSNKTALDSITSNVGTMAYENKTSYSSATQVSTALSNKVDKTEYATFSATTNTSIEDLSRQSKTVAAALVDLNTNKADKSTTYTKSEIDNMIGDIETLLAAI